MKSLLSLCLLLGSASVAFGQDSPKDAKHLEFEVAAIKPAASPVSQSNGPNTFIMVKTGMRVTGNRMDYTYASLHDLVRTAYGLKDYQVVAPDWMTGSRFDIEATLPVGTTKDDVPEMLRALLADRFKLTVHHDSKEHDVYGMVVAKGGPKLQPSDPNPKPTVPLMDDKGLSDAGQKKVAEMMSKAQAENKGAATTGFSMVGGSGTSKLQMRNQTLPKFADSISRYTDRPVVDMTGIDGNYDFVLEVGTGDMMRNAGLGNAMQSAMAAHGMSGPSDAAAGPDAPVGNSIAVSLQTYGLKLEKRKAPLDMVTVDHCEKTPTEN